MTDLRLIKWEVLDENIGTITFANQPGNLMNRKFFDELSYIVQSVIPQTQLTSVIIHGEGRHFSAGADLDDLLYHIANDTEKDSQVPDFLLKNLQTFKDLGSLKIPVVAVIKGVCVGSALELAMFCKYRICGTGSLMGLPEVSFDLIPGIGGIQNMIHCVGYSRAMEFCLSGDNLSDEEALQSGLIHCIVPRKNVFEYTVGLLKAFNHSNSKHSFEVHMNEFSFDFWQKHHNN
jgi:enoyl-CoA hydratase/carnithine racemase